MVAISTVIINALILSALYALVALGLTLIFSVGGVFNLAHGVNVSLGAFGAWYVAVELGFGIWVGALAAIILPAIFSGLLYRGMIQRIQNQAMTVMTVTLLIELISEYSIREVIGIQSRSVPPLFPGVVRVGGATITINRIATVLITLSLVGLMILVITRTQAGKAVLATSMSDRGSSLVGINKNRIQMYTWITAGILGGIAGLFFGSIRSAQWQLGMEVLVIAFPIVVLGGMGSIRGTLVASLLFGFLTVGITFYSNPSLTGIVPVVIVILILLARPQGLFGRELEV